MICENVCWHFVQYRSITFKDHWWSYLIYLCDLWQHIKGIYEFILNNSGFIYIIIAMQIAVKEGGGALIKEHIFLCERFTRVGACKCSGKRRMSYVWGNLLLYGQRRKRYILGNLLVIKLYCFDVHFNLTHLLIHCYTMYVCWNLDAIHTKNGEGRLVKLLNIFLWCEAP